MAPVTRFRVGIARMGVEFLALCYLATYLWVAGLVAPAIVATLLGVLRAGHLLAGVLGYRSLISSIREAVNRG